MAIIVKGRNAVVSPAVKAYLEKKIDKVTRQFKAVGDITAVLKVENGNHIAEITVPAKGILLRAQESTNPPSIWWWKRLSGRYTNIRPN